MKLSSYENEKALDLLADIIEPITNLFSDKKLATALQKGENLKAVKIGLKEHQKDIIEILARLDGVDPKFYKGNILTMTNQLMQIVNDEEFISFFTVQAQMGTATSSGSATENTEVKEV